MASRPIGTVTLLFTDIDGSARLLERLGDRYPQVLDDCRRLVRGAVTDRGGRELDTSGDGVRVAFPPGCVPQPSLPITRECEFGPPRGSVPLGDDFMIGESPRMARLLVAAGLNRRIPAPTERDQDVKGG